MQDHKTKQIAGVINEMAENFEYSATELRKLAKRINGTKDLMYVSEALLIIRNCFSNIRTELLVTRLLRD